MINRFLYFGKRSHHLTIQVETVLFLTVYSGIMDLINNFGLAYKVILSMISPLSLQFLKSFQEEFTTLDFKQETFTDGEYSVKLKL